MKPGFLKSFGRTLRARSAWKRPREQYAETGALKLHLGCGNELWPGYVNVDRDPASRADIVADFLEIDRFLAPDTVAEVCMIHSLSYLNLWQARDLFLQLHKLIINGGQLIIELPDIGKCAEKLLRSNGDLSDYLEGVRGFYAFDLGQIAKRIAYSPYAFGWSGWHLQQELEDAGFGNVRQLPPQTHGHPWRDVRVEALKPMA